MRAAEYLVVPSVCYETFSLVIVEAFANALPVLASRLGAMAELVTHGVTGLLFEPGSAEDLAEKMAWADAHPGEISQMGRAARQQYEMKYTPEKNYAILLRIYAEAMRAEQ